MFLFVSFRPMPKSYLMFLSKAGFELHTQIKSFMGERKISELRTCYVSLIEYLCKCGLKNSDICTAYGENEAVNHFLLTCPQLLSMKD